ncbi:FYN-binding protein 2 isoform X1 [Dipodomys merriami]|uniref:FYN-binding protein 2 isoform X1 n=1 Tax=Dipodomys merriami TaxID=94247 RepID=UPI0038558D66
MEEEEVRNFKELRAKFQKFDTPPLPGPIRFPAGVLQKSDRACIQSTQIWANGKPLASNFNWPPSYCSSRESQAPKSQKMKFTPKSEIQKCLSSPEPPEKSTVDSQNSQKASLLLAGTQSSTKLSHEQEGMAANSFRDKLWNWEKVSSQKSQMSPPVLTNCGNKTFCQEEQKSTRFAPERPRKKLESTGAQTFPSQRNSIAQRESCVTSKDPPFLLLQNGRKSEGDPSAERSKTAKPAPENQPDSRHHQLPQTKPLPSIESLGPPPPKPTKPPTVNLQAFQRQSVGTTKTPKEVSVKEDHLSPESAEFEEPHNYEATISYLRHCSNSINPSAVEEIADVTYEVEIEELQKPWKSPPHQELRPEHEDGDINMKEKESYELQPPNPEKDLHLNPLLKVGVCEMTPGKIQIPGDHRDRSCMPDGKQETMVNIIQTKACPEERKLTRHSQSQGGYVQALEVTKEISDSTAFRSSSPSEETYDDVEYPKTDVPKLDFSSSFASESEENSEEMYEDIYKTKSNHPKIDLDGKETLKRLQHFFKKEKDKLKMKKTKSKENIRAFSISLPDLGLKSQEVIIYDDVDTSKKEPNNEDKLKTWKPKFFNPKGKKEKEDAKGTESFPSRNFFRTKKQNLENKMEREEKLFRERFQYDKEIVVINRAVACSSNSRNGIFDLPITSGEQLEVIDTTEQNMVICRNSKGKYGYVLIEHLQFQHQGWSH